MDGRGVLGFPLRLGIAFLIIALFIPSLIAAADHFNADSDMISVRSEAGRVLDSAERVWYSGDGSSETVDVSLPPGYVLRLGGEGADAWSYSILKGDEVLDKEYTDTPKIRFSGDGFTITGSSQIKLTCTVGSDGVYGVGVTVA